jgi:dihydropteroate synthase
MVIGGRDFNTESKIHIMGILNVTPDSFSDGGRWNTLDAALRRAEQMVAEGAGLIDVGGESTRPGYAPVSVAEEIDRTAPVIEALRDRVDAPISIDTYKSAVARAALEAGATLVNDIWGLKRDPDMAAVIAGGGTACCLAHNRDGLDYDDFFHEMLDGLSQSAELAEAAGIPHGKIILDPGIGFAKTYEMNLEAINNLDMIAQLGYPVMLGASRKSVVGLTLKLQPEDCLEGTLATTLIGLLRGVSFIRVHDVKENARVLTMARAILAAERRE